MKKYNSFEELRATFGAEDKFTYGSRKFKLKSIEKFTNFSQLHMGIMLINANDLFIKLYTPKYIYHYTYESI